jgi:hypothetical protein
MSTYDDFDGVWFTIQAICLYHREVLADLSFVVIDNHPEGPAAGPLEALGGYVANYRYVPFSGYRGTAVHDLVFHETDAEIVCSLDCHVLLIPGALAAVQSWFADHPDSRDLLQGPILWDDLRSGATQMDPEWREGMYGIWATDPRFGEPEGEPFEIEMHGVGLLACRRAAWPGINPRFRGFGGEEGYVHEKFRRRGGHVLCHPALAWAHRFGRPNGVPYPNRWEERVRNYILGWNELGWDLAPVDAHFRQFLGEPADRIWKQAREMAEHPLTVFDGVFCVDGGSESCDAHRHPESVAWRVERVSSGPWEDAELRRVTAWRAALGEAAHRDYETALLLDASTTAIDGEPAAVLAHGGEPWDVCLLGTSTAASGANGSVRALDGRAVAIHRRAFGRILEDLGDDGGAWVNFLASWGDLDGYLVRRAAHGDFVFTVVPFAGGSERLVIADGLVVANGIDAIARGGGVTIRQPPSDTVYDLNHTALMIVRLCDGRRTVTDIADELAERMTLTAAPVAEVTSCVEKLRHAGILIGVGS